jgi:hypothetical protein
VKEELIEVILKKNKIGGHHTFYSPLLFSLSNSGPPPNPTGAAVGHTGYTSNCIDMSPMSRNMYTYTSESFQQPHRHKKGIDLFFF